MELYTIIKTGSVRDNNGNIDGFKFISLSVEIIMIFFIGNKNKLTYQDRTDPEYITMCNMEYIVSYLEDKSIIAVDTETEGLDFTCDKMIMFQIGDQKEQFVIDTRSESIEPLREILEDPNIIFIEECSNNFQKDLKLILENKIQSGNVIYFNFILVN